MDNYYYKKYEPLFGTWHIKEKIGEGAFARVFVIERNEMGVTYKSALKVISIPKDKNEIKSVMSDGMDVTEATNYFQSMVKSIVSEFVMMSKLKGNSHIVSYEDHLLKEHEDDIGWDILIRMELLTSLVEHAISNNMEEQDVIKLGIDLCKALEFCRKYDIIHRDIKPENIFIAPSGDYKLGDFGIAKTVEKTRVGLSRKGTYAYMAPEVYRGEAYGPSIDTYSLAIVMYKYLNDGRTPFLPNYPDAIVYDDRQIAFEKRLRGEVIPEPPNASARLKQIVLKACAFKAEDRYSSAKEMRQDLEALTVKHSRVVDGAGTTKDGHKYGKRKKFGKRKLFAVIIAIMLAMATAIYIAIPKKITAIKGIKKEVTMYIGDTYRPNYSIQPEFLAKEKLKFSSDNEVLEVSEKGTLTAVAVGESNLQISGKGYERNVTVKVVPKIKDIENIDSIIWIAKGDSVQLEPKLSPEKFKSESISYGIEDKAVANVDEKGKIVAIEVGKTKITVAAGGCEETYEIEVYNAESQYNYNKTRSNSGSGTSNGDGYIKDEDDEYF